MIEIKEIFALDDEELKKDLNEITGRIISVEHVGEYKYKVIYDHNQ